MSDESVTFKLYQSSHTTFQNLKSAHNKKARLTSLSGSSVWLQLKWIFLLGAMRLFCYKLDLLE